MAKRISLCLAILCLLIVFTIAADCPAALHDSDVPRAGTFRPPADPNKARLWALGCAAVLMERNGTRHDVLNTGSFSEGNIKKWKDSLRRSWNVEDRDDLLMILKWLENEGHRKYFEADGKSTKVGVIAALRAFKNPDRLNELHVARKYYEKLGDKSLWGWDISRYICLCRWGYTIGFISEEEAWDKIMPAARLLQKRFVSWEELGENYLIGRRYWSEEQTRENEYLYTEAITRLLESRTSPWVTLSWNTDLGDGPVLGEPWSKGKSIIVGEDANTISAAIDMAQTNDTVYLPRGLYKESGIKLKDGIRLMGDGMGKPSYRATPMPAGS